MSLKIIVLVSGIVFVEVGFLSLLVAMAYWPMKGVGVAGLVGILMIIFGIYGLLKGYIAITEANKTKKEKSVYY